MGSRMINARSETITEKPAFRNAFKNRRCLVPADGFFEWKKDREKTPFRILMKNRAPFSMAGIWDQWSAPDGGIIQSFSILTTGPNELMATIHDRMPVILRQEEEENWLKGSDPALLLKLLRPYPGGEMEAYAVSKLVNSVKNDIPGILEPAAGMLF